MKLYRIYTEDKNRLWIEATAGNYFSGFTIIKTMGYWKGKPEKSLIIEIIAQNAYEHKANINCLCQDIKQFNKQESVLLTCQEVEADFI